MLKMLLKYCFISVLLVFIGCAPKVSAPPPQYLEQELSLEDVIVKAGSDIEALKAIADIKIEKNNKPYDFINASILVRKPGRVHMRIYKFGMLVKDFVIKDKQLYVLSGRGGHNLKKLGDEFYSAIFWWDDLNGAVMQIEGAKYLIRAENKEIQIDRATLLPVKQAIRAFNKKILITYDKPMNNNGFWYSSVINISAGEFRFTVKLKKLLKNPSLGEFDFRIPAES